MTCIWYSHLTCFTCILYLLLTSLRIHPYTQQSSTHSLVVKLEFEWFLCKWKHKVDCKHCQVSVCWTECLFDQFLDFFCWLKKQHVSEPSAFREDGASTIVAHFYSHNYSRKYLFKLFQYVFMQQYFWTSLDLTGYWTGWNQF